MNNTIHPKCLTYQCWCLAVLVAILSTGCDYAVVVGDAYNRSALQQKYPGFGTEWIPIEQDNGSVVIGYFTVNQVDDVETPLPFLRQYDEPERVFLTIFTRKNLQGTRLHSDLSNLKVSSSFSNQRPSKFVTHGWLSSGTSDTCIVIKDRFLANYDVNVFIVDWSNVANDFLYPIPMRSTFEVAIEYGRLLNQLINEFGMNPATVHMVGHSLGAHMSGFAARHVNGIGRITGLDPALPGFVHFEFVEGKRLEKNDALFVDVIHTCGGFLGIAEAIGTADFYPNGGAACQPGCCGIEELVESCSHGRSWKLFAESINPSVTFPAVQCSSLAEYEAGTCSLSSKVLMGEPCSHQAYGQFYLRTASEPPYNFS